MTTLTLSRLPSVPAVAAKAVPLFASANAALKFALNYSMQQYDRPLMNRMAAAPSGEGKGLSGQDGAAQAGMIRAELARLNPIEQAALVAHAAQSRVPCDCGVACCSGWKSNPEWRNAMSLLTTAAASAALSGCVSNGRLRSALIQRLFGAKVTLTELAERYDVDDKTAAAHYAKLKRWLFGVGSELGLHQHAYHSFSRRLQTCKWINAEEGAE